MTDCGTCHDQCGFDYCCTRCSDDICEICLGDDKTRYDIYIDFLDEFSSNELYDEFEFDDTVSAQIFKHLITQWDSGCEYGSETPFIYNPDDKDGYSIFEDIMYDTEQYIGKVHHLQNYGFIIFCRSCAEINSYKQEQTKSTNEKDELKNENDELKNENDELKNENDELKNENEILKNENDKLLEKYYQLQEQYEQLQNDNYLKIFHNI
jgi:hypothetical protein